MSAFLWDGKGLHVYMFTYFCVDSGQHWCHCWGRGRGRGRAGCPRRNYHLRQDVQKVRISCLTIL